MATASPTLKVVEQHLVSPPPGTVPDTTLPITVFDVFWHFTGPVQYILFYPIPTITTHDFLATHFPALRRSLSLALQAFFSFAGTALVSPSGNVVISYSDGDSVPFIFAEADTIHFTTLASDQPVDASAFRPFIPKIPAADGPGKYRLFAAQVSVFPGAGLTLGVSIHHVAADGTAYTLFLKTWAAIHRAGGHTSAIPDPPLYDRGALLHFENEKHNLFQQMKQLQPVTQASLTELKRRVSQLGRVVLRTFTLTMSDIEKLRTRIMSVVSERPSTFVTVTAYVWTTLTKARGYDDRPVYFSFNADSRSRVDPKLPGTYIGNCICPSICKVNGSDLCGSAGLVVAARAIRECIESLGGNVLERMKDTIEQMARLFPERVLIVGSSPTFGVYKVDFGLGPPVKVQMASIVNNGAMTLSDSRDGSGGVEIGIAGPDAELDIFARLFNESLEDY